MGWSWELLDHQGAAIPAEGARELGPDDDFTGQSDAESWIGEHWRRLHAEGVSAVVLHEGDRTVYGPMELATSEASLGTREGD